MSPLPPLSLERNLGALPTLVSFRVSVQWCAMVGALATVENWGVPKKPLSSSKRTLSQYQEKTPALVASVSSYPAKPATAGAHLDALNCHFASLVSDFLLSRAASAPHPPARFDSKRTAGLATDNGQPVGRQPRHNSLQRAHVVWSICDFFMASI
ncbi:hypothetical protein MGG_16653 [Pyricularia oryzae 70-15]|uniref:Uncharacterized protein n=1 Tax=Pyricularia oryzae (strain 70-15 / ATCC MYA-4617 / FGSC 8958) TaxID=242507 RepID=G4N245_PYRO7|nr:uncharacterized protein MGG_16653 [Pyricularia oryzae 70-15]EHA51661.1 hypothetical protein MGG_16653 [Pyricularia oryzae 70-15]